MPRHRDPRSRRHITRLRRRQRRSLGTSGGGPSRLRCSSLCVGGGQSLPDEEAPSQQLRSRRPPPQASSPFPTETEPAVEPEPVDTDGDGVLDDEDFSPEDPKVQTEDDVDRTRTAYADYKDDFPKNAEYSKDADGDGVADARSTTSRTTSDTARTPTATRSPTPRTTSPPIRPGRRSPTRMYNAIEHCSRTTSTTRAFSRSGSDRSAGVRGLRDRATRPSRSTT